MGIRVSNCVRKVLCKAFSMPDSASWEWSDPDLNRGHTSAYDENVYILKQNCISQRFFDMFPQKREVEND